MQLGAAFGQKRPSARGSFGSEFGARNVNDHSRVIRKAGFSNIMVVANVLNSFIESRRGKRMINSESVSSMAEPGEFSGLLVSAAPCIDPPEILKPVEVLSTVKRLCPFVQKVSASIEIANKKRLLFQYTRVERANGVETPYLLFVLGEIKSEDISSLNACPRTAVCLIAKRVELPLLEWCARAQQDSVQSSRR